MGYYVTVSTAETNEKGMIKTPGAINNGLYPKNEKMGAVYPSLVIAVGDISEATKQIVEAGDRLLGEPTDIPSIAII